jgi:hypothetical protein
MPFSPEEFFDVFARYNTAILPLQLVACAAGLMTVGALWRGTRGAAAVIALTLAAMWAVNAIGYHWLHFAWINPAARLFGAVFVVQAALLAAAPWLWPDPRFTVRRGLRSALGLALIPFAAVVYPLWRWGA